MITEEEGKQNKYNITEFVKQKHRTKLLAWANKQKVKVEDMVWGEYTDYDETISIEEETKTDFIAKIKKLYPSEYDEEMTEEQAKKIYFNKLNNDDWKTSS